VPDHSALRERLDFLEGSIRGGVVHEDQGVRMAQPIDASVEVVDRLLFVVNGNDDGQRPGHMSSAPSVGLASEP